MENKNTYNNSDDEINLLELFKIILKGKKTIIRFLLIFGFIGFFIAIFSENEYTASVIVVPQTSNTKVGGNLGGLAAMAGINLGRGSTENISPDLYPKVVQSVSFRKELLKTKLKISNLKEEITYKDYYEKHKKNNILSLIKNYTIGLPSKIIGLFKKEQESITLNNNDSIYRVSKKESKLFKLLEEQLIINNNVKEGFVKISFSMPEALASAQMTKEVLESLQEKIIYFKTEKAKEEYNFVVERYNELKKDFEKKQVVLARFRDRNQGLITSRSKSHLESLESKYNLAFTLFSEISKQLETQKIKIKEDTPVFTVIEPVSVPVEKSKPKRALILIIWGVLGVFIGVGFILFNEWGKNIRETLEN